MYILAKLVFLNYIPEKFERTMMFKNDVGEVYGFISPGMPLEQLIEENGYPVKPYIMPISANPDDYVEPLVYPEQIGWWDEGPQSDELRDVTKDDLNRVVLEEDGIIQLEVSIHQAPDGTEYVKPELYLDKVTFGIAIDDEEEYELDNQDDDDDEEFDYEPHHDH